MDKLLSPNRPWHAAYPAGMPREITLPEGQTLASVFAQALTRHADRVAASCLGEQLHYAELDRLSTAFGAHLQQQGLVQGERVALMLPNGLPYLIALVGILRAGMVAVTVNPLYTAREVQHQLADAGAAGIVVAAPFLPTLEQVRAHTAVRHAVVAPLTGLLSALRSPDTPPPAPDLWRLEHALLQGASHPLQPVAMGPQDVALLQYTGGTTGVSKGAMLTHRSVGASLAQLMSWSGTTLLAPGASVVTPLPLYHVYPLAIALMAIACGAENRLVPNPRDGASVIAELRRQPFEMLIGVNTLFNALTGDPDLARVDFSRTQLVTGAGASVQDAVARRWVAAGGPPITEGYGLTETSPSATFNPPGRNGTIGVPVPSTDARIVDDQGNDVPMGAGGELLLKGPQLFAGYWQREDETKKAFTDDGWFRTGDIVRMDEAGFLYVVDRKKDMILVSGFNVYPNEIEGVVAQMPQVLECACVGAPDERTGEAPHLFVVARDPALAIDAIEAHCRTHLAAYKVPQRIRLVEALPKSAVGKILRKELRGAA